MSASVQFLRYVRRYRIVRASDGLFSESQFGESRWSLRRWSGDGMHGPTAVRCCSCAAHLVAGTRVARREPIDRAPTRVQGVDRQTHFAGFMVRRGCAVERVYRKSERADDIKHVPADEISLVPFHREWRRMVDAGCQGSLPTGQCECDFDVAGRTDKSRSVLDESVLHDRPEQWQVHRRRLPAGEGIDVRWEK